MTISPDARPSAHAVPIGDRGWSVWRWMALRSTGFPLSDFDVIRDPALAAAADQAAAGELTEDGFTAEFEMAQRRLTAGARRVAADPRFREAVAWQNPPVLSNVLDKVRIGETRNFKGRVHELTFAKYLQRYTLKNETIGFVGPVGWAEADWAEPGLTVQPGPGLLSARSTYFEVWPIDLVARAFAAEPRMRPWLVLRSSSAFTVQGDLLHRPIQSPLALTPDELTVMKLAEQPRTLGELAGQYAEESLERLVELGAVRIDLDQRMSAHPERALRERLAEIPDQETREHYLSRLDELLAARDELDQAPDAEAVVKGFEGLNATFERITGSAATRRPGEIYAGRTLLYQDSVRDVGVTLGSAVLEAMSPLDLLLDSARWMVARAVDDYQGILRRIFDRAARRKKTDEVALGYLSALATPDLLHSIHVQPEGSRAALAEFQQRWTEALALPEGVRRHQLSKAELEATITKHFPVRTPPFSAAIQHSPDLMIAAADTHAVARGDFLLVLGEMHVATNSLESRSFGEQHHDKPWFLAATEADHGLRRICTFPPKNSQVNASRAVPPAELLSPRSSYWVWSEEAETHDAPGPVISSSDMVVRLIDDELIAVSRTSGKAYPLLELLGEVLASTVLNGFHPLPPMAHRPRVTIDKLVMCREAWTFAVAETRWAFLNDEAQRFRAARVWRAENGLPERVFFKVPVEYKPSAADFSSLVLVNLLAKDIRRTAEAGHATFGVTEMLPDLDQAWLTDAAGQRYTAELRMVMVDPIGAEHARRHPGY